MALKVLAGPGMNIISRGQPYAGPPNPVPEVVLGTIDPNYPISNVCNGQPSLPARWSAQGASATFAFDFTTNLLQNGDMEQDTTVGWTETGSPTVTDENTIYSKGSQSLKMVTTAANEGVYQDVVVNAGEAMTLWASLYENGSASAYVQVQNLNSGNWLSAGSWTASRTSEFSQTAASWSAQTQNLTVESAAACGTPHPTLRVYLVTSAATTAYFDEVLLFPAFNFIGFFGHGFSGLCDLTIQQSQTNYWHSPSWTNVTALGNFFDAQCVYVETSTVRYPHMRCHIASNVPDLQTPWIGEMVMGQALTLPTQRWGMEVAYEHPGDIRHQSPGGDTYVYRRSVYPRRSFRLDFITTSNADQLSIKDQLFALSNGGAYPIVLIPDTSDAPVIFGRLSEEWRVIRRFSTVYESSVVITEEPLPSLTYT